jgi:hypothetical protein
MYSNTCAVAIARGKLFAVDRVKFEAVIPTLYRRVVVAVASGAHACNQAVFAQAVSAAAVSAYADTARDLACIPLQQRPEF